MRRIDITFSPIMEMLDEGLQIYRRHFARFMILAGLAALPTVLAVIVFVFMVEGRNFDFVFLLFLALGLVMLPVSFYIMAALSRAALLAAADKPVRLRRVLALGPLRVLGMGCYGTFFLLVMTMLMSMFTSLGFCVIYVIFIAGFFALSSVANVGVVGEAASFLGGAAILFAFVVGYIASLVINGAVYGSTVYALQPFAQEQLSFNQSMQRSFDLIGYRFGGNLLAFLCASLVFGATALAATLAVGVFVPLPILFLLGNDSVVAQAIAASAWIVAIAAAAPLLPIWMALLYKRRRAVREGEELAAQLAALPR
ncbi:MAG: hypothetical protein EI684_19735 [Candidatus Viridilinea halotolerans]|uniref:Glycerophosphoryl diester phosphodiesterase membrane domain-containing protein n=1 Tax=Candidatus Viridilinea halotolerans TaxID=2491704 RepID=A0A426TSG0_9CHLR|nr:MAG: hypothetical protein EI684_19735 [Candidatus Viridilinea halotolerans]